MCSVCGCSPANETAGTTATAESPSHVHGHDHGHDHFHGEHHHHHHDHDHHHAHHGHVDHAHDHARRDDFGAGVIDFGRGAAGVSVAGLSQQRLIRIEQDVLGVNNAHARDNRARLAQAGVFALNLVSSPGSGKTTLLVKLIETLGANRPVVVIEGDQQTSNDAARIRATGAPAVQINTGKGCHLDAHMVGHALDELPLAGGGLLFIENVGNLVCPAGFDLGEAHKLVILSVTEGEDKPLKYPDIFTAADLMILTKTDLLPHLDFDIDACMANALRINPAIQILAVSAKTGAGLAALGAWIEARAASAPRATAASA